MTPAQQQQATVANLLAHIDGSITRVCVECGAIFKIGPGERRSFCEPCQCKREENACCESPRHRTVGSSSAPDGTTFISAVCDNCGHRYQSEV